MRQPFLSTAPFRFLLCAALLAGTATATASAQPATPPASAASPVATLALDYVRAHAQSLGLSDTDLADLVVTGSYADAHNGLSHAFLCQRLSGHDVPGTEVGLHFGPNHALLTRTGSFVNNLRAAAARLGAPAVGAEAARNTALAHLHQPPISTAQPAVLIYLRQPNGTLLMAWEVQVRPAQGPDAWTVLVDAASGRVLKARNRIIRESKGHAMTARPAAAPVPASLGRQPTGANSYRVFAAPLESPIHGAAALAVSPADAVASPFGWHDTNGAAGAEYTISRGNNAYAYTPVGTQVVTPGFSPDGRATLEFDFLHNAALSSQANQPAALTNLFYWTNLMHDLSQRYGFSEASGNFQATNYSGQGMGDDYIRAQIGETYSEGYFETTPDGATASYFPQIVLGIWQVPLPNALTVAGTGPAAGSYAVMPAGVGPALPRTTPISGALVLANDGTTNPTGGCQSPWTNAARVRGNIAVADFSYDCDYIEKLRAAQRAGATALVLVHSLDFLVHLEMDPADTVGLRIPLVMVTRTDGQRIKAALGPNTTVTGALLGAALPPDRNGGFDNGIIAHEYAHGISTRLTGGPAGATACLDNEEQMGEGWSDFFELWMTTRPGDVGTTARGIGTYVLGQPTTGPGIRPLPYSTNFAANNSTYAFIGQTVNNVNYGYDDFGYPYDSHNIGVVWCTVLWDLNWALIQRYGYDANLATGTGGNNKALQLVMDGLKLQPCSPGFLDARDAILAADRATFGGANQALIWQVFARRGMGANAVQGSSDSLADNTAGFQLPAGLATTDAAASLAALALYPNPAHGQLTLRWAQPTAPAVRVELLSALGQPVRAFTVPAADAAAGTRLSLHGLAQGLYLVRLSTSTASLTRRVVVLPE